jgi:hypothetical protein
MQGDTEPESDSDDERNVPSAENREMDELNEALQAPLPSEDSDEDEEEEEDEDDDDEILEGAVGGIENVSNEQTIETSDRTTEQAGNQAESGAGAIGGGQEGLDNDADQGAAAIVVQQEIDPAIRAILGDLEVPEGIDASFLAALPSDMREEVINEHLR